MSLNVQIVKSTFRRLLVYTASHRLSYFSLFLIMVFSIFLDLSIAWFMGHIVDTAVLKDRQQFLLLLFSALIILMMNFSVNFFDNYLKTLVSSRIRHQVRLDLFEHMLRLPARFLNSHLSGELSSRITNDNTAIGQVMTNTVLQLVRSPVMGIISLVYLLNIYWPLAIICGCVGPLTLLIGKIFGAHIRNNSANLQKSFGSLSGFLNEVFSGIPVIRSFNLERIMLGHFNRTSKEVYEFDRIGGRLNASLQATSSVVGVFTFMLAFLLGAYFIILGKMTIGGLMAFIQLLNHVTWPFTGLAGIWGSFQQSMAAADRTFSLLDEPTDRILPPKELMKKPVFSHLLFDNVSVTFSNGKTIVDGFTFEAGPGKTIAIVGPSGAGKTTLFKVLMGLDPISKGTIRINGKSISDMTASELTNYFAFVPQESFLFSGTIRENICYGKPDCTQADVIAATKAANADDFIRQLPEGYDTNIGEKGALLSGGQRQRLCIARAIIKDAPILLLDEATASLDTESERAVQDALDSLMKLRTTFVIAHRLSTVRNADLILVMKNGAIVEQGTHNELLSIESGVFRRLYEKQFEPIGEPTELVHEVGLRQK